MFLRIISTAVGLGLLWGATGCGTLPTREVTKESADVCIYGATPSGIAAAVAAARDGHTVLLIEPTHRIGGLVTSGLSHTDFRTFEGLNGAFLEFSQRVLKDYERSYGAQSAQARDSFRGTFGEPKVNLAVFEQLLAEQPRIRILRRLQLERVSARTAPAFGRRTDTATFTDAEKNRTEVSALIFIDGTYEGDLLGASGNPFRVGREGRSEFEESLAPEMSDGQLQAYNFRWIMTREATNRVTPVAPPGYLREDFAAILPVLESGAIKQVFGYPSGILFKAQTPPLPNGKYDINDVSGGLVRLSLPGKNLEWPLGNAEKRAKIFAEHRRDQEGLLYFLQNDPAVPAKFRDEARQWGWCLDEFADTGHLPPQLYVREARRMAGRHMFTERDSEHATGDARAKLHFDSIAMGDYGNNCHGTAHEGPRFGGKHSGEFYKSVSPYQIPYGVIVPRECENLLVPVAVSASHVGFCALRLEPIWMSLGQAAGHAAHLAIEGKVPVQNVRVPALQRRIHAQGGATIYVSDILPGSADFAAVQWWGTHGGLHGHSPMPAKPGQRGKNIHGQYYEAYPGHAAELRKPIDAATMRRWLTLARSLGLKTDQLEKQYVRGDFIRRAHALYSAGK